MAAHVQAAIRATGGLTGDRRPVATGAPPNAAVQQHAGAWRPARGNAIELPPGFLADHRGPGCLLPTAVRQRMEAALAADFSDVRVHQGPQPRQIGALALTRGSDIFFAPGQYNPVNAHGLRLLAHELAHVVQQRTGRVRSPFGGGLALVQDPALEAEAERTARRVATFVADASRSPLPGGVQACNARGPRAGPRNARGPGIESTRRASGPPPRHRPTAALQASLEEDWWERLNRERFEEVWSATQLPEYGGQVYSGGRISVFIISEAPEGLRETSKLYKDQIIDVTYYPGREEKPQTTGAKNLFPGLAYDWTSDQPRVTERYDIIVGRSLICGCTKGTFGVDPETDFDYQGSLVGTCGGVGPEDRVRVLDNVTSKLKHTSWDSRAYLTVGSLDTTGIKEPNDRYRSGQRKAAKEFWEAAVSIFNAKNYDRARATMIFMPETGTRENVLRGDELFAIRIEAYKLV